MLNRLLRCRAVRLFRCTPPQDIPSYYLNSCHLAAMGDWGAMNGWRLTGKKWPQFACSNCNTRPPAEVEVLEHPTELSADVIPRANFSATSLSATKVAKPTNELFTCCYYSSPAHSYIQPMEGQGYDPKYRQFCPGTDMGLSLFGTWHMDTMSDCVMFGPYTA